MSPDLPAALPASMVEAAARALSLNQGGPDAWSNPPLMWTRSVAEWRDMWCAGARVALAAALAECEVRVEYGGLVEDGGPEPFVDWGTIRYAETDQQRLVAVLPASPVDTPREEPPK